MSLSLFVWPVLLPGFCGSGSAYAAKMLIVLPDPHSSLCVTLNISVFFSSRFAIAVFQLYESNLKT